MERQEEGQLMVEQVGDVAEQRLNALELANQVRAAGAGIRREVAGLPTVEGCRLVAAVLRDVNRDVGALRLRDLVRAILHVGSRRAGRLLHDAEVQPARFDVQVARLTVAERERVAMVLERYAEDRYREAA